MMLSSSVSKKNTSKETMGMGIGNSDRSIENIEEDDFNITQYVEGLANFIIKCTTPMTISIQGDWGSGKTSMMNMVKNSLLKNGNGKITPVFFNTWQYSQFHSEDNLTLMMMNKLVASIDGKSEKAKNIAKDFISVLGNIAVGYVSNGTANIDSLLEKSQAIEDIKNKFANIVEETAGDDGRVVFFIDDLDRLNPGRAVEILEILKIFLDCDKCVFVLAIDYGVVSQGVKEKYGDLIGEDKGQSFFDKIIQVPFTMPVSHYNVDSFVINMFKQVNIDLSSKGDESKVYVDLIRSSVGLNPRTMKRLFNAYLLLNCISDQPDVEAHKDLTDSKNGEWVKKMLFAILCCQHAYKDVYTLLVENAQDIDNDFWEYVTESGSYVVNEDKESNRTSVNEMFYSIVKDMKEDERSLLQEFMKNFNSVIDRDKVNGIDESELETFQRILSLSTITSSGNKDDKPARGAEVTEEEFMEMYQEISDISRKYVSSVNSVLQPKLESDFILKYMHNHIAFYKRMGEKRPRLLVDGYIRKDGLCVDVHSVSKDRLKELKKVVAENQWTKTYEHCVTILLYDGSQEKNDLLLKMLEYCAV